LLFIDVIVSALRKNTGSGQYGWLAQAAFLRIILINLPAV